MNKLFKTIKSIYKRFAIRFIKKDSDNDIDKVIKVEDYGDYNIQIVYTNDYLNKNIPNEIKSHIKPHVVFLLQMQLDKDDIIKDYFDNLLVFMNINLKNHKYIMSIKENTLYSYISLNDSDLKILFEKYYSSIDSISFLLSKMISLFNDELNNEMYSKYIPERYINYVDTLPFYKNNFRSFSNTMNNVIYIDNIPNISYKEEKVFSINQLLTITNIFIITDTVIDGYDYDEYEYNLLDFLKYALYSENNRDMVKDILFQLENDSYFYIYGKNLLKYVQQNKLVINNIYNEDHMYYNDIDEII